MKLIHLHTSVYVTCNSSGSGCCINYIIMISMEVGLWEDTKTTLRAFISLFKPARPALWIENATSSGAHKGKWN